MISPRAIAWTALGILGISAAQGEALSPTRFSGADLRTAPKAASVASVELKDSKTATVLVFLSARCPCSRGHENALRDLHRRFSKLGFTFLGVHSNADEPLEEARAYFSLRTLPFPVIRDEGSMIANRYGALKTPHAFIIDRSGEMLFSGGVDDSKTGQDPKRNHLERALQSVARGARPDPKEVRTLGCVIQRP